ncbi:F-box/kelch-repeat protein At3g23880-like [Ipomoea triloba]|uniref:F-box/kelch-repeat protein At3g23880-like n=1 Tax=Ipomoea triloba TaxID=35885 RepID=UPI00125E2325|nr:F-box/kelch-repeat protein At3g23880-like [Ipomoea triloba]
MEASASLSNLPQDIIRHILLQLPVKCVIRCQCVCKQWRSLIDDSDFKFSYRGQLRMILLSPEFKSKDRWRRSIVKSTSHDLRLRRHKWPFGEESPLIREDNLRVLCSCNGLVLLLRVGTEDIWLWNPSTKCSTKVLESPYPEEFNHIYLGGLCYDSCTSDYKVVLLIHPIGFDPFEFGYPFYPFFISASFKHKKWRQVQFPCNSKSVRAGLEFRNTFHWWASDMKDWDWYKNYSSDRNKIVYFDPAHDEFRILPLPTPELSKNFSIFGLGVIDDCLCMAACLVHDEEEEPKIKTIWIMKEYGRQESWMIAFTMQMPELGDIYGSYGLTFYSQKKNFNFKTLNINFAFFIGFEALNIYEDQRRILFG